MAQKVEVGKYIRVEYTGTFDDGTVFDSTADHEELLGFTVGAGQLIKGFDDAVVGMQIGDEKSIHLAPEQGYGNYSDQLLMEMTKEEFGTEEPVETGMQVAFQTPDGHVMVGKVTDVTDTHVKLDMNHPLAGKSLNFKLKVAEILDEAPAEEGCGDSCGSCCGGCGHDHC